MFPGGRKRTYPPELPKLLTAIRENGRCIYHADIKKNNFLLLRESSKVCIIDFQDVGVLPQVFQTLAFFNSRDAFASRVGRKLGYEPFERSMANALGRIMGLILMMACKFNWVLMALRARADKALQFSDRSPCGVRCDANPRICLTWWRVRRHSTAYIASY